MPGIALGCNLISARQSVGAPHVWTPADLFSGGEQGLWLDSADVAIGSGDIASWPNRAGGWADPSQPVVAERPQKGGAAWNDGVATVATNGLQSFLMSPPVNPYAPGSYTFLWAGNQTGFNYARIFSASGTTTSHRLWLNGSPNYKAQSRQVNAAGTTVSNIGPAWVRNTETVVGWQLRTQDGCYSIDGGAWSAPVNWLPTGTFSPTIYSLLGWTDGSGTVEGTTRSILIISRNLSDAEVDTYAAFYGK